MTGLSRTTAKIRPKNLSKGEQKCTLTQTKPLSVTEGAAARGHGLCQTRRCQPVEGRGGLDTGEAMVDWVWKRGVEVLWLDSLLPLFLNRGNWALDQIIRGKTNFRWWTCKVEEEIRVTFTALWIVVRPLGGFSKVS